MSTSVNMAEKKKSKKRKEEYIAPGSEPKIKPSKDEFSVAQWMRKNVTIKKTKFLNHNVEYFTAKRAVDALVDSKWTQGDTPLFTTRDSIVNFLQLMLEHKFYHRARKIPVSEQELKGKKNVKKAPEAPPEKGTDAESSVVESKEGKDAAPEKEKRKKKIRLDMHNDQQFVDGLDAYVWIYDPIPFHYWIFGTLLVLGAIGVCLFPLWPPSVRLGVYYLSVAAAGFLVAIIALAVIRLVVFCLIWGGTLGRHHLWILPNLTEDVGFMASFWPLYMYEYRGDGLSGKKAKGKKKKKDKDSDAEEEPEEARPKTDDEKTEEKQSEPHVETLGASETESESSQRSSTGKDFEMVDQDELES